MKQTKKEMEFDSKNASTLAELCVDPLTTEHSRVQILQLLLSQVAEKDFFTTMFKDELTLGECPSCGHQSHWLIPEDVLNTFGYVSSKEDTRVKEHTTKEDCKLWQECCVKKKTIY